MNNQSDAKERWNCVNGGDQDEKRNVHEPSVEDITTREDENKRLGGTVYVSFIDVTENKFVLSYRLSNDDLVILDLEDEFAKSKRQTINFEKLFH